MKCSYCDRDIPAQIRNAHGVVSLRPGRPGVVNYCSGGGCKKKAYALAMRIGLALLRGEPGEASRAAAADGSPAARRASAGLDLRPGAGR